MSRGSGVSSTWELWYRNWDELWDLLCRALRMDLRGKPSTFSADGTEKLVVGEDGLDGGSLVVSMMAAAVVVVVLVRAVGARLCACECVKRM